MDQKTHEKFTIQRREPQGWSDLWAVLRGHFERFAIYNPLGLVAATTFMFNLKNPWWHASIHQDQYSINAYAFVLSHNLPSEAWEYVIETPRPAIVILLLMLLGNWLLSFWGSTMSGRKGKRFLLLGGVFMLIYTAGFYGSLLYACHRVGKPVVGQFSIQAGVEVIAQVFFLKAYYQAIGAAALTALSSLIHGWIPIRLHRRSSNKADSGSAPATSP